MWAANYDDLVSFTVVDPADQWTGSAFELDWDDTEPLIPRPSTPPAHMPGWDLPTEDTTLGIFSFVDNSRWFPVLCEAVTLCSAAALAGDQHQECHAENADGDCVDAFAIGLRNCERFLVFCLWIELGIRIVRRGGLRNAFMSSPAGLAVWHWCELLLAVCGARDISTYSFQRAGWLHVLAYGGRLFIRIAWVFYLICTTDCTWAEAGWFQSGVGVVIALNALVMGAETDVRTSSWWWIEQALLTFFVFELIVRLRLHGRNFITNPDDRNWNVLDFIIVVSGVFDQWVMEIWSYCSSSETANSELGEMMMLARMLRLMRIMRLVRVVKAVRPLHDLAVLLVRAMQSMFWVLVLTFVALYSFAILTTTILGRGLIADNADKFSEETQHMFSSIPDSMFTLFAVMNGQDFQKLEPLLEMEPYLKPLFVIFTIYCSWALLSVMTGVVSDHMQAVRETQYKQDQERIDEARQERNRVITQVFASADTDGDGTLCKKEFLELAREAVHVRRLHSVGIPTNDMDKVFHCLDVDESGTVELSELEEILEWLSEPVTGRQIIRVDSSVKYQSALARRGIAASSKLLGDVERLQSSHKYQLRQQILHCFDAEMVNQELIRQQHLACPTEGNLDETEGNLDETAVD